MRLQVFVLGLVACSPSESSFTNWTFQEPDAAPELRGTGGPQREFTDSELMLTCGDLDVGDDDTFHHRNLVATYRGHLVLPWAPEWGRGGLGLFNFDDPCNPELVGTSLSTEMRESHAIGFMYLPDTDPYAGDYAVVTSMDGALFWDISDPWEPEVVGSVALAGVAYPDAYARVVLSVFWQYPYVYVAAADNGVFVLDARNPRAPRQIGHYVFEPGLRAGGVFALGNKLLVTAAKEVEQATLDISNPSEPVLVPNGRFVLTDQEGIAVEPYHGNLTGNYALFARKSGGGGPLVYDVSDPSFPVWAGEYKNAEGSGGYLFYKEGLIFQGDGDFGAIYDASNISEIEWIASGHLEGDLDTFVPYGNVGVLAVDDGAVDGVATTVVPWRTTPDSTSPTVLRTVPADGAKGVETTSPLGVGFDEFIEPSSVFAGSIRLWDEGGRAVDGWGSAQETIASYVPKMPLQPNTLYRLEVMAQGITDISGNSMQETVEISFTTGSR